MTNVPPLKIDCRADEENPPPTKLLDNPVMQQYWTKLNFLFSHEKFDELTWQKFPKIW